MNYRDADASIDAEYDYNASSSPTSASALGMDQNRSYNPDATTDDPRYRNSSSNNSNKNNNNNNMSSNHSNASDALHDLAQLEELQHEAERMKATGNKHMAAQEYLPAYNAYSAALQLSPVGPSSHVFLSNRAAALLSLKRYPAAATDARRAVALAPTFGKAHARLGQALYFLKDYGAAVAAYQDALVYEPDNGVTQTYLTKALSKWEKQKAASTNHHHGSNSNTNMNTNNDGGSVESSMAMTMQHSVVTDTGEGLVTKHYNHGTSTSRAAMLKATAKPNAGMVPEQSSEQQQQQSSSSPLGETPEGLDRMNDPEFEEAVRIQQRANSFLANKLYRQAIEEYTAALFLVPDDINLSPDLHLGRAHALNGSRRHESARNDALLALKLQPSAAAYSTLAKSLFYVKDYQGAVKAFGDCERCLPPNESLGMFDQAYLEKADAILQTEAASLGAAGRVGGVHKQLPVVPKLKPPRFVPREVALRTETPVRSMPKQWPQQSPTNHSRTPLHCGPEESVQFLTESLGVKLNRGPDGIVRVLSVTHDDRVVRRNSESLQVGKVVREAAGVDIRRPITNIMWGDTVALIKMAPRPIVLVVAEERSPVPGMVREEQRRQVLKVSSQDETRQPSRSSDDGAVVKKEAAAAVEDDAVAVVAEDGGGSDVGGDGEPGDEALPVLSPSSDAGAVEERVTIAEESGKPVATKEDGARASGVEETPDPPLTVVPDDDPDDENEDAVAPDAVTPNADVDAFLSGDVERSDNDDDDEEDYDDDIVEVDGAPAKKQVPTLPTVAEATDDEKTEASIANSTSADQLDDDNDDDGIESVEDETAPSSTEPPAISSTLNDSVDEEWNDKPRVTLRDEEDKVVGGEILFLRDSPPSYGGWDTLRWMAYNGARKVNFCQPVHRQMDGAKKRKGLPMFWKTGGVHYEERALIVYDEPSLFLIVRRPATIEEIKKLLGLPDSDDAESTDDNDWALNPETALLSYWILESIADPATTKLRLSSLTTATSVTTGAPGDRERSCFEVVTPTETLRLSAVNVRDEAKKNEQSFADSGAFLETLSLEASIAQVICGAHSQGENLGNVEHDIAWKHQVVVGTLHSLVISGNQTSLDAGIQHARASASKRGADANFDPRFLPSRIVDAADDNGFPALYYGCTNQMEGAVRSLVNAGADVNFRTEANGLSMSHIAARNLDDKILSTLLSASYPTRPDPNALDKKGRTPMYVAMVEGSVMDNGKDPSALGRCISALEAWGGKMMAGPPNKLRNPISALSYMWLSEYVGVALDHASYRFPLQADNGSPLALSLSAFYQYPVHSALIALRKHIGRSTDVSSDSKIVRTLRVLFDHGFEPNERLDRMAFGTDKTAFDEFIGFAPIQILAVVALEVEASKADVDEASILKSQKLITNVAECLVRSGARLSLDPPCMTRARSKPSDTHDGSSAEPEKQKIQLLVQKLDADKQVLALLGGESKLNEARKVWTELPKVTTVEDKHLADDDKSSIENSMCAGGSDELSCSICWAAFGTLMNRKHKCRVMNKFVCDECSSKRLFQAKSEHRISDGQYLVARVDVAVDTLEQARAAQEAESKKIAATDAARSSLRLERLEAQDKANRESVFGGILGAATKMVMGEDTEKSDSVDGLKSSLNETRDALNQRGEKLTSLEDKSAQMVDASADFAKMAKELRKQSEGGLFW